MTDEAFEQIVRSHTNTVFRVACHAVKDRQEAEDVTQTVLLRLYQYTGEFQSEEHMKHWLLRVTVNESRKILRSPWRKRTVPLEDWDAAAEGPEERGVLEAVMALDVKYRLPATFSIMKTALYGKSLKRWAPTRLRCKPGSSGQGKS